MNLLLDMPGFIGPGIAERFIDRLPLSRLNCLMSMGTMVGSIISTVWGFRSGCWEISEVFILVPFVG